MAETKSRRRARPGTTVPPDLIAKPPRVARAPKPERIVLVTGFEPFGGETMNPSWEVCELLPGLIDGARIETLMVPCRFRMAIEIVATAMQMLHPTLVVCLGQAGGRDRLSFERVGINVDDARIPDNAGAQPIDEPISVNGPPAYFATLPVKAMARAARAAGVPAEVSNTAGTFVCNHLLYGVLHFVAVSGMDTRAGFVHVPFADSQVADKPGQPSMALASMARGLEAALAAALESTTDIHVSEGKEA